MKVLIACEFSGIVRQAFTSRGHEAWSCDLLPTEQPGNHIQDDVLEHLSDGWDLMIAHPPCTFLSHSGVAHLLESSKAQIHGAQRIAEMEKAAQFFNRLKSAPIYKIAMENPTPHKRARDLIGHYHQIIHPWLFGVPETKRTCLWLKNLPPLMATLIESIRLPRVHFAAPGKERWKVRSRTPVKVAEAMAKQWG